MKSGPLEATLGGHTLAVLLAMSVILHCAASAQCSENDEYCSSDGGSNGRSMLQVNGKIASDILTVANRTVTNSSKPDDHSGLPGDVVVTEVTIKCGMEVFAPMGQCPDKCPFYTSLPAKGCFFKCVAAKQCGTAAKHETVPDEELGVCRSCNNPGCAQCATDGTDTCTKCARGYKLQEDGSCASDYVFVWKCIMSVVGALLIFLVIWLIQLGCAPITNHEGLDEALAHRSSMKLHTEEGEEGHDLYPLSTNLHVTQVAGPGLTLHMNFQMFSVMWSCGLITVWLFFVYMTDARQLTIGLLPAETGPQLCSVTMLGRSLQEEQMPFKVTFICIVYLITFLGSIGYAINNKRVYENIEDETGMEDFAALVTGLPPIKGADRSLDSELKECLEKATGEEVVGVSICWDFGDQADEIQDSLDKDLISLEPYGQPVPDPNVYDTRPDIQKKIFGPVDTLVGGVLGLTIPDDDDEQEVDAKDMVERLENMTCTNSAFVVFDTEASRDRAIQTMKQKDVVAFRGGSLKLKKEVFDPKVVLWENFNVTWNQLVTRMVLGVVGILVALVIYSVCFYLPFAYYQSMFKFPNEPGAAEGFIFSMLVVAGNQIMYQICAAISDGAGFRFRDSAESLYVALYVLAVLLSVVFDMSVEFYLGYHSMADAHVKTADGRPLESLTHWQEIFESYPMQKVLGERLFAYCFPATFTIPFLVEPVGTLMAPFMVQRWLLRTHPEVRGRNAEKSLDFFAPMDMGRYGDILVNMLLVSLIFFFPSGSILPILLTYAVSHLYIYAYDQYRMLRCVPAFDYGSEEVDKYTQWMMVLPCSVLASALVFKANCMSDEHFCVEGWALGTRMVTAFFGHAVLHFALLNIGIYAMGVMHKHKLSEESFKDVASKTACTWFTANPIHCLRSKYIQKDSPPCCYYVQGKEHLIRKNPKIGVYYENNLRATREEY